MIYNIFKNKIFVYCFFYLKNDFSLILLILSIKIILIFNNLINYLKN